MGGGERAEHVGPVGHLLREWDERLELVHEHVLVPASPRPRRATASAGAPHRPSWERPRGERRGQAPRAAAAARRTRHTPPRRRAPPAGYGRARPAAPARVPPRTTLAVRAPRLPPSLRARRATARSRVRFAPRRPRACISPRCG